MLAHSHQATSHRFYSRFQLSVLTFAAIAAGGGSLGVAAENELDSRRKSIRWDPGDGSIPKGSADGHAAPKDSFEDLQAKSKMNLENRTAYDKERKEAEAQEIHARVHRFAVVPAEDQSPLAVAYKKAFEDFRESISKVVSIMNRMSVTYDMTADEVRQLEANWDSSMSEAHSTRERWITKGMELFVSDPVQYENVGLAMKEMFLFDAKWDRADPWKSAVKDLFRLSDDQLDVELALAAVTVAIANNEYDLATNWGERLKAITGENGLMEQHINFLNGIPEMKKEWERELSLREREAKQNNNPRVELKTTKGRIEIELFEDDAPQAVANFIYLVERGFYDRKSFFRVEQLSVAQTGCEKGDGTSNAGYTVASDITPDRYRIHLRGTCSLALGSNENEEVDVDSGSSQFYIALMPLPHLDKKYTVFGRVVSGLETIGILRHMNLAGEADKKEQKQPDYVLKAKVLKKRDHEYKPTAIRGRLF